MLDRRQKQAWNCCILFIRWNPVSYRFISPKKQPCDVNSCRRYIETCVPDSSNSYRYRCEYTGCPTESDAMTSICHTNMTCQSDEESDHGYSCVSSCLDHDCNPLTQKCQPSGSTARGYVCEYVGCPADKRLCPPGMKCILEPGQKGMGVCIDVCYENDCTDGMVCALSWNSISKAIS